jgi:hypothetical protein
MRFEDAANPKWDEFDKEFKHVHDWRTYVTDGIRESWLQLSIETRLAVIEVCQNAADNEHWN